MAEHIQQGQFGFPESRLVPLFWGDRTVEGALPICPLAWLMGSLDLSKWIYFLSTLRNLCK